MTWMLLDSRGFLCDVGTSAGLSTLKGTAADDLRKRGETNDRVGLARAMESSSGYPPADVDKVRSSDPPILLSDGIIDEDEEELEARELSLIEPNHIEPNRALRPEEQKHNFRSHVRRQDATAVAVRRIIGGVKPALIHDAARRVSVLEPEHLDSLTLKFDRNLAGRLARTLAIAHHYGHDQVYAERYRATGRHKRVPVQRLDEGRVLGGPGSGNYGHGGRPGEVGGSGGGGSLSKSESGAVDFALTTGKVHGKERIIFLDKDGKTLLTRRGPEDGVHISNEEMESAQETETMVHNHPGGSPPSRTDLDTMFSINLPRSIVATDKAVYLMMFKGDKWPSDAEYGRAMAGKLPESFGERLQMLDRARSHISGFDYHVISHGKVKATESVLSLIQPSVEDNRGWHGVDLDSTLARHDQSHDVSTIGDPVAKMVRRVKRWLANGELVKIVTARVADDPDGRQAEMIRAWTKQHIGQALPVTNEKDPDMIDLWDDRARRVEPNTGEVMSNDGSVLYRHESLSQVLLADGKMVTSASQDQPGLVAQAAVSDLNNWLTSRVRGSYIDNYKKGLRDAELEDAILGDLFDMSDSYLGRIAVEAARSAVAGGRHNAFQELEGEIARYVRSEAMDKNTCDECAAHDGDEWDSLDDVDWSPGDDCEGADACRGQLMPVFEDEGTVDVD